jgi:PAS domain S-box-containing protein
MTNDHSQPQQSQVAQRRPNQPVDKPAAPEPRDRRALPKGRGQRRWRYVVAVAIALVAAALRFGLLGGGGGRAAFVTFYPAVMLAALYGGLGAGLLATVLSALLATFWLDRAGSFWIAHPADVLSLAVFLLSCTMITWITEAMRRAQARASQAEAETAATAERARGEEEREVTIELLRIANASSGTKALVEAAVRFFREKSGCEAVGIRLRDGDDYPYYEAQGFPERFVQLENALCVRDAEGEIQRDAGGNPVMACMCGNVICGRFDASKPFFTPAGSFWANDTTRLLATTSEADRQGHTRNRCNGMGYESVALIALRVGEQRLGLLQLNDRRKNRFTPELIARWERLAGYLAGARAKCRAEEALRDSEARLRRVLEVETVGVMFWDLATGVMTDANDAFLKLMGYSRSDVEAGELTWQKLTPPEYHEVSLAEIRKFTATGRVGPYEKEYFRKDGTRQWLVFAGSSLGNNACVEFCVDISDRKKAEAALRESERGFRTMADAMPQLAWIAQPDGYIFWYNRRWYEYTGTTPQQMEGWGWQSVHDPDALPTVLERWKGSIATGEPFEMTFPLRRADGEFRVFLTRGQPLKDDRGRVLQWFGTNTDIEELNQAEEAQRLLAAIVQTSDDAILSKDLHGTIMTWNAGAQRLFGFDSSEVMGKSITLLLPPDRLDEEEQILARLHRGERIEHYETIRMAKDGRHIPVSVTVSPLKDPYGHIIGASKIVRDITERKRLEETLRRLPAELERQVQQRTAELEAANKELEAFSYTVSHDLRAPLRHVTGFVELLDHSTSGKLDDKSRRYVRVISESAQRMGHLIDDLLALSRIGRATMTQTDVSLEQLVDEARRELAGDAKGRAIDWQIGALPTVRGDRVLLRSAMVNLLSNAIKYTRPRSPALVEIGSTERDGEFVCFVRDNGVGFDMRFVEKLFGVFQRLHRLEDFEGTGIGLASVRRIIQRHGGKTWAEGCVDGGATFYFSLPKGG